MFGLGFSEILVILALALIVVGPDKLPELAQKLGRIIWQLKHTAEEFRKEIALPPLDLENPLKRDFEDLKKLNQDPSAMIYKSFSKNIDDHLSDKTPSSEDKQSSNSEK